MKINIAMMTIASLLISACSTTPRETTATQDTVSAAATGTAQPAAVPSDEAGVPLPAESAVSTSALTAQMLDLQKKSIYFDFDTFTVKGEYHDLIQQQAELLKSHPNVVVTLEGNADERGSPEYNLALGNKRAYAVRKSLMILGVADKQTNSVSFGEEKPKLSCHEEKCWGENRRVDFVFKQGN